MRQRGFSLIEVLVAATIAVIVGAIAVQATVATNKSITRLRRQSPVQQDARLLSDFLFEQVQEAGGGLVRPWHAIVVDDGCVAQDGLPSCGGAGTSDRLRIFSTDTTRASCQVTARTSSTLTSTALDTDGDGTVDTCCPALNGMGSSMVALTDPDDASRIEYYHTAVASTSTSSCTLGIKNAGVPVVKMPLVSITRTIGVSTPAQITPGAVFVYQVVTSTADPTTKDLVRYEDTDHNNVFALSERSVMAPRVYDLQGALGYDGSPADGRLTEDGTTADEWRYMSAGDGALPPDAVDTQLRMARFGVVLGTQIQDAPPQSVKLLNRTTGVSEPGMWLAGVVATAYLRNTFLFE